MEILSAPSRKIALKSSTSTDSSPTVNGRLKFLVQCQRDPAPSIYSRWRIRTVDDFKAILREGAIRSPSTPQRSIPDHNPMMLQTNWKWYVVSSDRYRRSELESEMEYTGSGGRMANLDAVE